MTSSRSKFAAFEKKDIVYTTVAQHQIQASVLTPRRAADDISPKRAPTTAPVLVYWHGGGFIVGDRLYEPWWPVWLLEFALAKGAMIIAPDYRLLPEATGADIMDDMHAFWNWFLHSLPGIAASDCWDHWPDVHRVISAGHSAGGSLALHSAMQRPDVPVRAVLSLYGPLYYDVPELRTARPRPILGVMPPPPRQAEGIIRTYVQRTKGTVRTAGDVLEMWGLVACILQQGRLPRMMMARPDPRLDALAVIERRKWCPPIWVVHGESDSVVPASCSIEFVRRVEQIVPGVQKRLSVLPGEHNFDASLAMEEPWITDGCTFLENHWNE